MIRTKDLNKELMAINDVVKDPKIDKTTLTRVLVKAVTLLVKVVRDIRTNQVLDLKNKGIQLLQEDLHDVKTKE